MKYRYTLSNFRPSFRRAGSTRILPIIIVAALMGAGYVGKQKNDERQQRRAQQEKELNATISEYRGKAAEEIKKDGYIGDSGLQMVDKMKSVMEKGAAGSDADSKVMGVMARFLGTIGTEGKALLAISTKLRDLNAFDLASHTSKEAIAERRKLATELSAKNKSFLAFFTSGSSFIREELRRVGITGAAADVQIRGFEQGQQRQSPMVTKVRQADIDIAGVLIELCDLSAAELGKFSANKGGKVIFDNPKASEKYNALVARLTAAADVQSKAQQFLVDNMRKK